MERKFIRVQVEADKAVALSEQKYQYANTKLQELDTKYQSLKNEHLKNKEKLEQNEDVINVILSIKA